LADEIKKNGTKVLIVKTDVSKQDDVGNLVNTTLNIYGRIDILVNNAGWGVHASVEDTPVKDMKDIFDTNFMGPFNAMKLILPIMKKQRSGHIMNVSSVIGRRGIGYSSAYCATKFALIGLTESLQVELRNTPVRASIICPGLTDTDFGVNMREPTKREKKNVWATGVPATKVANAIVRCAKKPKREVYISLQDRGIVFVNTLCPGFMEYVLSKYRRK
jgi:short-subunit dehydrogenase